MSNAVTTIQRQMRHIKSELVRQQDLQRFSPTEWKEARIASLQSQLSKARDDLWDAKCDSVGRDNVLGVVA